MNKEQLKEAVGELNLVDTVFEADGVSYIDTAVSVTQVYDLIGQLDEPEKAVIPKYYAKLKEVHPPEKEWLTNLSGSKYYAIDTKGLMLGEFLLDLVGLKTEASTHALKGWERYGINGSNADFVEVEE